MLWHDSSFNLGLSLFFPCIQVRAALGVKRTVISGGGSLAAHLDMFYEMIGLTVLNGWGLTETSPVLAARRWGRRGWLGGWGAKVIWFWGRGGEG